MRFSFQSGVRNDLLQDIVDRLQPGYYPDIFKPVTIEAVLTLSPHASTARDSYTVPANKRALLLGGFMSVDRVVVPTVSGFYSLFALLTNSLGTDKRLASITGNSVVGGHHNNTQLNSGLILKATDKVRMHTSAISTGGSIQFNFNLLFAEFDA